MKPLGVSFNRDLTYRQVMPKLPTRGPVTRKAARHILAAAIAMATGWHARGAHAQSEAISSNAQRYRSEKSWAIEFKMGPYRPDIDSEFTDRPANQRPHQLYFGSKQRLLTQAEVDYQVFQGFGSLAVGFSVGYFRETAKAFVQETVAATPVRSGDSTKLTLIPTSLSLVYRFDPASIRWGVPLVPYVKGGLDWVYWSVGNGNDEIAADDTGNTGRGDATGYHAAVGLSLLLDVFDPGAAQEFDSETGVNHTYLFVELGHYNINGLGGKAQPRLGDTTWSAGFLFEF